MFQYLSAKKKEISDFLNEFMQSESAAYAATGRFGKDTLNRLYEFACRGKMIRGGLVVLGHELFNGDFYSEAVKTAAALELFQSALLIHDDIMDRDTSRRGEPTLYYQYAEENKAAGINEFLHIGEAMGICAGDVAFFCAYTLLAGLSLDPDKKQTVLEHITREMGYVGTAQMLDVFFGAYNAKTADISQQEILNLYKFKTGRYTIALPLATGARIAGASIHNISALESLGEKLGIIFQIKDDELGLFGDTEDIGKPVGSDIREGKKTVFYQILQQQASATEQEKLLHIFGNPDITQPDIDYVRNVIEKNRVREKVSAIVDTLKKEIESHIANIEIQNTDTHKILESLVSYSITRTI
ncbi:MAG: polyprenyl synthetase family protein [Spirochaetales bacterium]|nr:polyprenyl synthetase family protein [Spirochaetales bacterium]